MHPVGNHTPDTRANVFADSLYKLILFIRLTSGPNDLLTYCISDIFLLKCILKYCPEIELLIKQAVGWLRFAKQTGWPQIFSSFLQNH